MEPADRPDGAAVLSDDALDAALRAALAPRGLAERVRLGLGRGFTALQVWERLPAPVRATLGDEEPVAVRAGVERVRRRLDALAATGDVLRARERMTVPINTKGPRDVLVDVYRLALRSRTPRRPAP